MKRYEYRPEIKTIRPVFYIDLDVEAMSDHTPKATFIPMQKGHLSLVLNRGASSL